jgi:hypothetical protein
LNKAHIRTLQGLKTTRLSSPFKILEFYSNNGSGFINHDTVNRQDTVKTLTHSHSRSCHKNDNCFAEQKNGAVVREYIGHDRLEGDALQSCLAAVYRHLAPLPSFFMPTMKLENKVKTGSKEVKKYDAPRSPYRCLMESEALPPGARAELTRLCGLYNPVRLQHNVNKVVPALREAVAALSSSSGREPAA